MDTSKFAELGLNEQILAGVEALGFSDPTPVQAEAIPLVLAGRDVVASAQTGTGKTAAFALPVLQVIAPYSRAARENANAMGQSAGAGTNQVADTDAENTGSKDVEAAGAESVRAEAAETEGATAEATNVDAMDAEATNVDATNAEATNVGAATAEAAATGDMGTHESGEDMPREGDSSRAGVLEDAMPSEPHLSESLPAASGEVDASGEADASGDAGSAAAAPKRPRRRHHKKVAALSEAPTPSDELTSKKVASAESESSDAVHDQATDANNKAADTNNKATDNGGGHKKKVHKRRAKKPKVVEVDRDVLMRGEQAVAEAGESRNQVPDAGADEGTGARAHARADAGAGNDADAGTDAREPQKAGASPSGVSDTSTDAKVAGTKHAKPKRKRRKKHAKKKKGGLAAEIAAAEDANARPFGPFALVITPTRELAQQIDNVVSTVCEHTGQRAVIVMGGAKFERQIRELQKGCDMLVATPGRLIDLMDHNHVDLSQVKVLVLDEADRMLDMGFWPSVRRIVGALPKDRQTLLFSATIPPSIKGTVDAMLHDPAKVEIARIGETADTVEEHLCPVTQGQKIELLEALIRHYDPERVLVFCRTKHRVDDVSTYLARSGLNVDVMHSDRSQKERERALAKFRAGKCKVLVATDVMSRGIDVSGIDAVVNFDVPMDPEDYVHRIGRTGRAGHTGLAFTFAAPDEISPLREIEYFTKKLIPVWDLEGFEYDSARIVPNPDRSTKRASRTMFNGARSRGRGIGAGRYGRHY